MAAAVALAMTMPVCAQELEQGPLPVYLPDMTFTCQPTERDDTVFNPAVGYYEPNVVDLTHAPPVNAIVYLSRATISVGGIIFPLKTISFEPLAKFIERGVFDRPRVPRRRT